MRTYFNMFLNCSPRIEIIKYIIKRFKGEYPKFEKEVFAIRDGHKFNCGKIMENCKVICDSSDRMEVEIEGGTLIDIGAHIGKHSIPIAKRGFKVIAIEPTEETFYLLNKNILLNQTLNMHPYKFACSEKEGELEFNYDEMHPATNSLMHSKKDRIRVKCFPLDIFKEENISVIKMDVEGAELSVLKGAKEILTLYHPAIYFECWKTEQMKEIESYLNKYGYGKAKRIDEFNYIIKRK